MTEPPLRSFDCQNSQRLVPSRYSERKSILATIADNHKDLDDILLLSGATNDRLQGEERGLIGISTFELIYGIPNAYIVNAAYTHTSEFGGRFNDYTRGAWYAADRQEGSVAEVSYHKSKRLSDIISPKAPRQRPLQDVSTYDDWIASFQADFHFINPPEDFSEFLQPEPVPHCYASSQALARHLLNKRSNGLVYRSVRDHDSNCIACFRPALVYGPRRLGRLEITWTANETSYDHHVRPVAS